MGLCRRGDGHRTQGLVLQDFHVGAEHRALGVLLFEGSELIFVAVADRGKRVEVMKVPHEVLTPVSRTDTRDRFHLFHATAPPSPSGFAFASVAPSRRSSPEVFSSRPFKIFANSRVKH